MVSRKQFALFVVIVMTAMIGDLVYRVFVTPPGFPYDLLVVMLVITIAGLYILAAEFIQAKWMRWLIPALLLGSVVGLGSQIAYDHLTTGVIQWERHLANLGMMLATFGVFVAGVLVVVGVLQARSKSGRESKGVMQIPAQ